MDTRQVFEQLRFVSNYLKASSDASHGNGGFTFTLSPPIMSLKEKGGPMSYRTKLLGLIFIATTIILAIVVQLFHLSSWLVAAPAILMEILFLLSAMND